jgi:hypothetical protein
VLFEDAVLEGEFVANLKNSFVLKRPAVKGVSILHVDVLEVDLIEANLLGGELALASTNLEEPLASQLSCLLLPLANIDGVSALFEDEGHGWLTHFRKHLGHDVFIEVFGDGLKAEDLLLGEELSHFVHAAT